MFVQYEGIMKNWQLISIGVILWLSLSCFVAAQDDIQHKKDSLRIALSETEGEEMLKTYSRLAILYFMECNNNLKMDTLLNIYAEMDAECKKQGNFAQQGVVRLNILSMFQNRGLYDEVIKRAPGYLEYLAEKEVWKYYYQAYGRLLTAHLYKGDFEETLEKSQQLYDLAVEQEHDEGKATALYTMAKVYQSQNRFEEYERCCRQCLEIADGNDALITTASQAWYNLCQSLLQQGRYEETLEAARKFEKTNERYEAYVGVPIPSTWVNLWDIYSRLYLKTGDYDKAETYCDKMDSIIVGNPSKIMVYTSRAQILNARKQYEEALEMINRSLDLIGDVYTAQANGARGIKTMILSNMGRTEEAYELFQVAIAVHDSIRNLELSRQIDELHTQYEVSRHILEKERNHNYFLFTLTGCALLLSLLVVWIIYSRRIDRKNYRLVQRIKELDHLESLADGQKAEINLLRNRLHPSAETQSPENKEDSLYGLLKQLMKEERPYTDPAFNGKTLTELLRTNERYLREAVKKHTGLTLSEYITRERLEYARYLIAHLYATHTNDAIAVEAGFGSRSTFYRLFREHYGLSPEEYRKNI